MNETLELSIVLPVTPQRLYSAWLDGEEHSAMTGSPAEGSPIVGAKFTAWDGYIWGENKELEPPYRIVQSWRTSEFPPDSPDSQLKIQLQEMQAGTRLTLKHSEIPHGQAEMYRQGWQEFYFEPMSAYFS